MKIVKVISKNSEALASQNLEETRAFYSENFDLEPKVSHNTLKYAPGLSFKKVTPWVSYIEERVHRLNYGNRHSEIILIPADYEKIKAELKDQRIIVSEKCEDGSRYFKLYDPDNHIIEIGEKGI